MKSYERLILAVEHRFSDAVRSRTQNPLQIAVVLTCVHVAVWAAVTMGIALFTFEDSMSDAFAAGAVSAGTVTSAVMVTIASVAWATVNDRKRGDTDATSYSRTMTLLLSVFRPGSACVAASTLLAGSHPVVVAFAVGAAVTEAAICWKRPAWRVLCATTLFRFNETARRTAIAWLFVAGVLVIACGAHVAGMILRAFFGVFIRFMFKFGQGAQKSFESVARIGA